jgi:hypothetical protein
MPLIKREPVIEPVLMQALHDAGGRGLTTGELRRAAQATPFKSKWGVYSALKKMFEKGQVARVFEYWQVGRNRFGAREYRYFLMMYTNAGLPGIEMPGATAVNGFSGWTPWSPGW